MAQNRSIALCIVLTIITFGIYGMYWCAVMNNEVNACAGDSQATSGGMVVLLTIITCGIYGMYWGYKMGQKVDELRARDGESASNCTMIYLLLNIFGLSIITYALMQSELNRMAN